MRGIYKKVVLSQIPRILSLEDRNNLSRTYGCLDRQYWHYKTFQEFPSSTYQQPVLTLGLLYKNNFEGNLYYRKIPVLNWVIAGMLFWCNSQKSDGSFDEWYINEHSFCATAFTSWAISETYMLLEDELPQEVKTKVAAALFRSGVWMIHNDHPLVANQRIAAMHSLHNIGEICKNEDFLKGAERKKTAILDTQDEEGWFPEYEGADIGYSLVQLEILASFYNKTKDAGILAAIDKLIDFIYPFILPDGSISDECGSRSGQYLQPNGLETAAFHNNKARVILKRFLDGLERDAGLNPYSIDDKYLAYFYINSFAKALCSDSFTSFQDCDEDREYLRIFKNAGFLAFKNGTYHINISFFRNGVVRIYHKGRLVYSDLGYLAEMNNGRQIYSYAYTRNRHFDISTFHKGKCVVCVKGDFVHVKDSLPLIKYIVPFKLFTGFILKNDFIARMFKGWLISKRICFSKSEGLLLTREVTLSDASVEVNDSIIKKGRADISRMGIQRSMNIPSTPSARYFLHSQLDAGDDLVDTEAINSLNSSGEVRFSTKIALQGETQVSRDMIKE
ncbi:MAG: hypothetical protein ABH806_02700 [Candidatus Omnitrophota bacterium]